MEEDIESRKRNEDKESWGGEKKPQIYREEKDTDFTVTFAEENMTDVKV